MHETTFALSSRDSKECKLWFLYVFWELNKCRFQIPWRMCSEFVKACNAGGSVNREHFGTGREKRKHRTGVTIADVK